MGGFGIDWYITVCILPTWARFLGTRTNFIRARTTSRVGPSTGKILVRYGYKAKSFIRQNLSVPNQFCWYVYFFHPSRAKIFPQCKWGFSFSLCVFVFKTFNVLFYRRIVDNETLFTHVFRRDRSFQY